MDKEINKSPSRAKFIFLALSAVAFFSVFKFLKTSKKKKTIKLLTQNGKLVELNEDLLPPKRKKITNGELQTWIHQKK